MKKITGLIFALACVCALFASCNGNGNGNGSGGGTVPPQKIAHSISVDTTIEGGQIVADKTSAVEGEKIKLQITSEPEYAFDSTSLTLNGAKIENGGFDMPNCDVIISGKFVKAFSIIDGGANGNPSGKMVQFGLYPQTIKPEDVTIVGENADGLYLGDDNNFYQKLSVTSAPNGNFSDGQQIENGQNYFFKIEPIVWRVVKSDDGLATLMCSTVLDCAPFQTMVDENGFNVSDGVEEGTYANNWEFSDMRKFLNDRFFNAAFSKLLQSKVVDTVQDNPNDYFAAMGENQYALSQRVTIDKVFLANVNLVSSSDLGFLDIDEKDPSRALKATDYAKARGLQTDSAGGAKWAMKTPLYSANSLYLVEEEGFALMFCYVNNPSLGIVPMLTLDLNAQILS